MSFNDMVTCPLNKDHRVMRGRLAKHLVRCARTMDKDNKFAICPYNATHRIIKEELEAHIKVCEDNIDLLKIMNEEKPKSSVKQVVEPVPQQVTECEEDWDQEADVGTYSPHFHCLHHLIVRSIKGQPRAVRQSFRESERQRFANLKKN